MITYRGLTLAVIELHLHRRPEISSTIHTGRCLMSKQVLLQRLNKLGLYF